MKTNTKRMVSVVLLLTLLVSLFSGLTLGASAAEPTSASEVSYKKNGNYIYNWGKRDTTATFLTTYAQAYYTGNYTYASLSAKTGTTSTSADAIYNSALGTALHNMLAAKQTSKTSYDGTRSLYRYTDCEQNADKISSFYSAMLIGPSWDGGKTWNREHTWPNSKGLNGSDETDIMMLRPTSVSENSSRGNNAYGEGVGCYDPNELGQSLHGDVARLILQHLIRWGNTELCFGSTGVMESRAILLKWLAEDPVDTWEMGRNDAVQAITGVRNVFVDYPELAFQLLGASVPSNYPTPSKGDSTGGDSGDPSATYTVKFSVPSGVTAPATQEVAYGASVNLKTPSGTPADSSKTYTFVGWVTAPYEDSETRPTYHTGSYAIKSNITFYALYSYASGSAAIGYAKLTDSTVPNGDYVIVSDTTGMALGTTATNNWLIAGKTYTTGSSIATPNSADVWTITNGVISAKNGNGSIYSSAAKKIALSSTDSTVWSFTNNGDDWTIANDTVGQLSYNSFGGWRPYSGGYGSDKTFVLYRAGAASTTYYTTNPTVSDGSLTDENLKFFGKTVIFEADFSIKYYVPKAVVDTYDSVYVSVTKSVYDADGNVTGKKTTKVDVTDYNSGYNAYGFKFAGIAAAEVGSNVDATVYGVKDGKTYEGATQSGYSVKQYCYNTLSKANTTAANKRVLVDFLNYASAAQVYFNINTKNLVNAELTDEQKAFGTATVAAIGNDRADGTVANATVAVSGCTLIFEGKIMMKFVFDPATYLKNGGSLSDLSVVVKDAEGKVLKTFAAADFEDYGTRKSVVFDGLASTEMRKAVTFQVMVGDTAVSNSRTYSIQSYAYSMQNDAAQGTLVQEMIKYGDSMVAWKLS